MVRHWRALHGARQQWRNARQYAHLALPGVSPCVAKPSAQHARLCCAASATPSSSPRTFVTSLRAVLSSVQQHMVRAHGHPALMHRCTAHYAHVHCGFSGLWARARAATACCALHAARLYLATPRYSGGRGAVLGGERLARCAMVSLDTDHQADVLWPASRCRQLEHCGCRRPIFGLREDMTYGA